MNSIFEIFKIGLGPSSSHTVGPMKASKIFRDYLIETDNVDKIKSINIILYGSLAFTGKGHNIDTGLILGLFGYDPEKISNSLMKKVIKHTSDTKKIDISNSKRIKFDSERDIIYDLSKKSVNSTNKMKFIAYDSNQTILTSKVYLSIGGGFIIESKREAKDKTLNAPYSFSTCEELLELCDENKFSIDKVIF